MDVTIRAESTNKSKMSLSAASKGLKQRMNFSVLGIGIKLVSSAHPSWNKALSALLAQQLEGFGPSASPDRYKVEVRDIAELVNWKPSSFVPGQYGYSDGLFYDYQKKVALQFTPGLLKYWCAASVSFSVHYLVHLALIETERCFIHAAGISVHGEGVLFPAFGGIGKTLIVGDLLKTDGVRLLGDDIISIDKAGFAESYPRPFCLYEYHKAIFPSFYASKNLTYLRPGLLWRIYKRLRWEILTRCGFEIPSIGKTRTHKGDYVLAAPSEIFGTKKMEDRPVPIKKILWLSRDCRLKDIQISEEKDIKAVAQFSIDVTQHEWTAYYKTHLAYLLHSSQSELAYKARISSFVEQGFQDSSKVWNIRIPDQYPKEKLVEAIRSILDL